MQLSAFSKLCVFLSTCTSSFLPSEPIKKHHLYLRVHLNCISDGLKNPASCLWLIWVPSVWFQFLWKRKTKIAWGASSLSKKEKKYNWIYKHMCPKPSLLMFLSSHLFQLQCSEWWAFFKRTLLTLRYETEWSDFQCSLQSAAPV